MKKKPFNNPFGGVKLPEEPVPVPKPAPPGHGGSGPEVPAASGGRSTAAPRPRTQALTEDELWTLATEGADPLADRSAPIRPGPVPLARGPVPLDPDLAAYDELRALVLGEAAFDLSDSDEFIEGGARDLDPRVLKRLRKGEFSVQGHVDLHGLSREEARPLLEAFLVASRTAKKRCVLVVHGRGLHSKDQVPVLKDALRRWMSTARFAQHVLAFATARPHDGGAGAVYVLLRKQ